MEQFLRLTTAVAMPRKRRPLAQNLADSIGERIAHLRRLRGITQKDLAVRLGVTQPIISGYERGELRVHGDVLIELTRILKVSADEILGTVPPSPAVTAKDKYLLERFARISELPKRDRLALLRTINAFLAKAE